MPLLDGPALHGDGHFLDHGRVLEFAVERREQRGFVLRCAGMEPDVVRDVAGILTLNPPHWRIPKFVKRFFPSAAASIGGCAFTRVIQAVAM